MSSTGLFISFEGIDGAGKSSHIQAVSDAFRAHGRAVVQTREPGGTALAEKLLGCKGHEPSANGMYSLESVYCLGLCASSPAVQIDDRLHARVNEAKLTRLVQTLEAAA